MGDSIGVEVEFAAVEEDSDSVVVKVSKPSGSGFDGLDAAVETFAHGVGDFVTKIAQ